MDNVSEIVALLRKQADLEIAMMTLCVRQGPKNTFIGFNRYPLCPYTERGCGDCGGILLRSGAFRVCADESCGGVHLACPECGSPCRLDTAVMACSSGAEITGKRISTCAAPQRRRCLTCRLPPQCEHHYKTVETSRLAGMISFDLR